MSLSREGTGVDIRFPSPAVGHPNNQSFIIIIIKQLERGGVYLFSIINYICRGVAILYILYKRRSYPFIFVRGVDILYLMCKIIKGVDILLFL